jgi:hypothetical protein
MLTDAQWAMLEPLVEACRPRGKTAPQDLRRTSCHSAKRNEAPVACPEWIYNNRNLVEMVWSQLTNSA